jgi:hypothetical protein
MARIARIQFQFEVYEKKNISLAILIICMSNKSLEWLQMKSAL